MRWHRLHVLPNHKNRKTKHQTGEQEAAASMRAAILIFVSLLIDIQKKKTLNGGLCFFSQLKLHLKTLLVIKLEGVLHANVCVHVCVCVEEFTRTKTSFRISKSL